MNKDVVSIVLGYLPTGDHIFHATTSKYFDDKSRKSELISESRTIEQIKYEWPPSSTPSTGMVQKAARLGRNDIIEFLVSKGSICDISVWMDASAYNQLETLQFIRNKGWELNYDYSLQCAIMHDNIDMVKFSIENLIDEDFDECVTNECWQALANSELHEIGIQKNTHEIVQILWKYSIELETLKSMLKDAAWWFDIEILELFLFLKDTVFFWKEIREEGERGETYCRDHDSLFDEHEEDDECWYDTSVTEWMDENGL